MRMMNFQANRMTVQSQIFQYILNNHTLGATRESGTAPTYEKTHSNIQDVVDYSGWNDLIHILSAHTELTKLNLASFFLHNYHVRRIEGRKSIGRRSHTDMYIDPQ